MARSLTRHVSLRQSIMMLLTILTANTSAKHGLLHPKRADTCSGSSQKCGGVGMPDNFCCSSSSMCIALDGGSSVICCPEGQDCSYIQPITCDVTKQNASLHPGNVIKTTRLDDDLPTCGNACCPFGYTCVGSFCAMDDIASSSTSTSASTRSSTASTSTATLSGPSAESSVSSTRSHTGSSTESSTASSTASLTESASESSTTAEATTDSAALTIADLSTVTVEDSTASNAVPTPTLSQYSTTSSNNLSAADAESSCPSFPTNAVLAGFFPGAVFGAVAGLLITVCIRRHRQSNLPPGEKVAQNTFRKSTGTLIGISEPIASDESSFRTDFLLSANRKRNSEGSRSVLSRSRSRVKSLFTTSSKPQHAAPDDDIPAVPPVPAILSLPVTPPQQRQPSRQPSTESIRVYTPPGVFTNAPSLNPSPYLADQRPDTTLTEILNRAQASVQAESASSSGTNSETNSTPTNNTTQRFLLPPPQKLGRRKQLPY
ncbi:hypothetical protein BDW75DRAFT_223300 [Aspergillus navahoensis]